MIVKISDHEEYDDVCSNEFGIELNAAWNFLSVTWGLYGEDRESYTDGDPSGDRHRQYDRAITIVAAGVKAGLCEWPIYSKTLV
jgi:hypothetical protein